MTNAISRPEYLTFLAAMKERILQARASAGRAVNRELILLYWDIGRSIVEKQKEAGWGDSVVERLAADLRAEFPDMRGFSSSNLWRMRQFYIESSAPEFLAQAVPETEATAEGTHRCGRKAIMEQAVRELAAAVPWGHHVELLKKIKDPLARLYYLRATARFG